VNEGEVASLAIVLIFGGGTLFLLAISPVGRAIGDRIRGRGGAPAGAPGAQAAMLDEVQQLHQEVGELAERVDFMERLLAKSRDADRLAPPR
jgi:hypothetical protein